jgi:predicted secreted protein
MPDTNPSPGSTIEATVGKPFTVSLESAAGGGYRWLAEVPQLLKSAEVRRTPGGPGIGAAATETFEFTPLASGTAVLRFKLKRSWEASPQKVVEYPVKVQA